MSTELEAREVEGRLLTWNGIPVMVTGRVETHHGNWELISNSTQEWSEPTKAFARAFLVGEGILRAD